MAGAGVFLGKYREVSISIFVAVLIIFDLTTSADANGVEDIAKATKNSAESSALRALRN